MWRARAPEARQIQLLRAARERFDLHPLVVHVNYLTNLASLDPIIRSKSIDSFRGELVRTACERQYTLPSREEKLAAVRKLAGFVCWSARHGR